MGSSIKRQRLKIRPMNIHNLLESLQNLCQLAFVRPPVFGDCTLPLHITTHLQTPAVPDVRSQLIRYICLHYSEGCLELPIQQ